MLGGILIYFGAYTDCVFLLVCIANMIIGLIQEIRAKQGVVLANYIENQKGPVVLAGDFNSEPKEDAYK